MVDKKSMHVWVDRSRVMVYIDTYKDSSDVLN